MSNAIRGASPRIKAMGTPIMRKMEKEMRRITINTVDNPLFAVTQD
jgi:hypothetical protein